MVEISKKVTVIGNIFKTSTFNISIKKLFSVDFIPSNSSENEIIEKLKYTNVCVIGGSTKITESILKTTTNLEVICFAGTQYETSIKPSLAKKFNIEIIYTPGINAWAVSEHTIALIFNILKKISYQNFYAKQKIIKKDIVPEIRDSIIGIIGFGGIGQLVGNSLRQGFGSKVHYWSRTRKPEKERELNIFHKEFNEIIAESDVIVLAIPETIDTKNIIGAKQFAMMKKSAILINTARPYLVDPTALYHALSNDIIKACAFDGYYIKQLNSTTEDPYGLLSLPDDKFILTPYTASRTNTTLEKVDGELFNKILAFYKIDFVL